MSNYDGRPSPVSLDMADERVAGPCWSDYVKDGIRDAAANDAITEDFREWAARVAARHGIEAA